MKKDIHPNYREVVFLDTTSSVQFITRSTINTRDTVDIDGVTYPLVKLEVSSASHPFYTGKNVFLDTTGRVEKFQKKYQKK
jgi:large subunit ribosomal protein L31